MMNDSGYIYCPYEFDFKTSKAWAAIVDTVTGASDTCKISIVPWVANQSNFEITQVLHGGYRIFGKSGDSLMVNYRNMLYKTGTDLTQLKPMSPFPLEDADYYWAYLQTPAGSFIRNETKIYFSKDEKKWTLDYTTRGRGIRNSFSYTYDSLTQSTRVYTHDYSTTGSDTFPHSVYRKTISPVARTAAWEKVFTFYSKDQLAQNKKLFPACRHIHTLVVDPYTGHIWIGTGDIGVQNHIYYSDDKGDSWKQIGYGTQEWRVLSIWFTANYVYWAMDSQEKQKIFRVSRKVYNEHGFWPEMSQKLDSGYAKPTVQYVVDKLTDYKYKTNIGEPAVEGDIVYGNPGYKLDKNNSLISLNDPALDYREVVASLPNSALWGNTTVVDDKGDDVVLITSNAEGQLIDNRPRVFGFKERLDGSVDIQELLSTDAGNSVYAQLYPYEQDGKGNMYFQTYMMNWGVYKWNDLLKTTLHWNDNSQSKGGFVVKEDTEADPVKEKLKLVQYDGNILQWQQADKSFVWKDMQMKVSDATDTISICRESNKVKYVRALVQKKNNSPVASGYITIDSIQTVKINNTITFAPRSDANDIFCYPNPVLSSLFIHFATDTVGYSKVEIASELGRVYISKTYNFLLNADIAIPVNDLESGIYFVKVIHNNQTTTRKIIIK